MLHPLTGQPIDPSTDLDVEPSDETNAARLAVSDLLMATGKGLFLVFLGYLIVDSFPLQLLIPNWQLAFVARLLSISSIPLVGFACVHLAVILNPANRLYSQRLGTMRRLAMVAAIGFLLLIPLQGYATWTVLQQCKIQPADPDPASHQAPRSCEAVDRIRHQHRRPSAEALASRGSQHPALPRCSLQVSRGGQEKHHCQPRAIGESLRRPARQPAPVQAGSGRPFSPRRALSWPPWGISSPSPPAPSRASRP